MAPRPIPDAIAGPTDPHVAATFYNPAAIGYLRGIHVFVDGALRLDLGSIDLAGGAGGSTLDRRRAESLDAFAGLTWDLATDTLTIGLAVYTPFTEFSSYPFGGPLRFHEQTYTFTTLEETLAGAWQIERHISVGASFIVNESWLDYGYARDLAPAAARRRCRSRTRSAAAPAATRTRNAQQQIRLRGFDHGFGFSSGSSCAPTTACGSASPTPTTRRAATSRSPTPTARR